MKKLNLVESIFWIGFLIWVILFFGGIGIYFLFDPFLPTKTIGIFCLWIMVYIIYEVIKMNDSYIMPCDCKEDPEDAYKEGEDLLTDDFVRECRICGRAITPEEFSEPIEEHDYERNKV